METLKWAVQLTSTRLWLCIRSCPTAWSPVSSYLSCNFYADSFTNRLLLIWPFLPPANVVCEGYVFTPVCHSVHRGGMHGCSEGGVWLLGGRGHAWLLGGACMVAPEGGHEWLLRGHAWLLLGGMCGCSRGGMHGCSGGGACVVFARGACMVFSGGVHGFFQGGRA